MKIGCGFVILCIVGLAAISMLYYSIAPYVNEPEESPEVRYETSAIVVESLQLLKEDSSEWQIIPILSFSTQDGDQIIDTAYHEHKSAEYYGPEPELKYVYFETGRAYMLSVNRSDPYDYHIVRQNEYEMIIQELGEYRIVWVVLGSILMLVFLRGLSKAFAYKEPPAQERM